MGKIIIITGAAGNLGTAVVKNLLDNGSTVVGTVLPGEHCKVKEKNQNFEEYPLDVSDEKATHKFADYVVQKYRRIDFAALLVGGFAMGTLENTSLTDVRQMMHLNFETAFVTAQAIFKQMKNQKSGGHILFVGAKPALEVAAASQTLAYALSKNLVFHLADHINETGKKRKIKASVIVPSIIDTPANRQAMPQAHFKDWVTPEEIAGMVTFLVSEKSQSLRETILKVYGNV